jgi:hypothetical protein
MASDRRQRIGCSSPFVGTHTDFILDVTSTRPAYGAGAQPEKDIGIVSRISLEIAPQRANHLCAAHRIIRETKVIDTDTLVA